MANFFGPNKALVPDVLMVAQWWLWMCIFLRCEWCEPCANLPDYKTFKRIVHTRAIYVIENNMQSFKVTKTTCQMVCVSPIHATNSSNKTIQWIVRRDKRNSTAFFCQYRILCDQKLWLRRASASKTNFVPSTSTTTITKKKSLRIFHCLTFQLCKSAFWWLRWQCAGFCLRWGILKIAS